MIQQIGTNELWLVPEQEQTAPPHMRNEFLGDIYGLHGYSKLATEF